MCNVNPKFVGCIYVLLALAALAVAFPSLILASIGVGLLPTKTPLPASETGKSALAAVALITIVVFSIIRASKAFASRAVNTGARPLLQRSILV